MRALVLLALLTFPAPLLQLAAAEPLAVGGKAPPLGDVTWVKGAPVEVGKGRAVIEFWATWCAPCRQSIPHLTKLQAAHPEVTIAGLTSEEPDLVKPFVEKQGAEMEYHVGICPDATWNAYMEGIQGPPHAYIVDADGTILWEGHPMALDGTLDELKAGTFDAGKAKKVSEIERKLDEMTQGLTEENHDEVMPQIITVSDEALALDPFADKAIQLRLKVAEHLGDHAAYRATFSRMPVDKLNVERANGYAWKLATASTLLDRNLDLALTFAQRAVELDPASASCAETLARVSYDLGLLDQAIAQQRHATELDAKDAELAATLKFYLGVKAIAATTAAGPAPAGK